MGMIERGDASTILLWKWSRLSRSRKDWAVAADTVETLGGRIESATEAIDTSTSTGRLARGVMVEFAAFESERIGDVWREAHARRVAAGLPANGKPRFGYQYDREQKLHIPDPVTGPVLAQAYRRYLAGESTYKLTLWLRDSGTEPVAGYGGHTGEWSTRTVQRVLDSGFAAGMIRSAGELLPGAHEALISEHEWARYQRRRGERSTRRRGEVSQYLLSGMTRCGVCGGAMQIGNHRATGPRLRCRQAIEYHTHRGGYIQLHYVEDSVRTWLADTAAEIDEHIDPRPQRPAGQSTTRKLEQERERITAALTRLAMQLAEETITPEVHARAAAAYDQRLTAISSELERTRVELSEPQPTERDIADLDRDWAILPVEQRREALRSLIAGIVVTPGQDREIRVQPRIGEARVFRP